MSIDYAQIHEKEAVRILSSCLPLSVKLEMEGYKAELTVEERELLASFKNLWLAGWLKRGIHALAGLGSNDVLILRAAMMYELRTRMQLMHLQAEQ